MPDNVIHFPAPHDLAGVQKILAEILADPLLGLSGSDQGEILAAVMAYAKKELPRELLGNIDVPKSCAKLLTEEPCAKLLADIVQRVHIDTFTRAISELLNIYVFFYTNRR